MDNFKQCGMQVTKEVKWIITECWSSCQENETSARSIAHTHTPKKKIDSNKYCSSLNQMKAVTDEKRLEFSYEKGCNIPSW